MASKMWWYTGGAWHETLRLWVWNGSWTEVVDCWVWDGGAWDRCYDNPTLASNTNCQLGFDPLLGQLRIKWTTHGNMAALTMTILVDWSNGTPSINWATGIDPTILQTDVDFSTNPSFTSLDNTSISIFLWDGAALVGTRFDAFGPYSNC